MRSVRLRYMKSRSIRKWICGNCHWCVPRSEKTLLYQFDCECVWVFVRSQTKMIPHCSFYFVVILLRCYAVSTLVLFYLIWFGRSWLWHFIIQTLCDNISGIGLNEIVLILRGFSSLKTKVQMTFKSNSSFFSSV